MFCGACGDLLDRPLPSRGGADGDRPTWWRRPVVGGVLAVIALVGIAAAVPTLSIESTDPVVDASIDVPDVDDLQAPPANTRTRRTVEPPDISCTSDDVEVDCVAWSRGLAEPMGTGQNGRQTWPMGFGDRILLVGDGQVEAVDAATGTRMWRTDMPEDLYPVGQTGDLLMLLGSETRLVDLDTGETRWSVSTFGRHVFGDVVHDDVVYTGTESDAPDWGVSARDPQDGTIRWTWPTDWPHVRVQRLDDERLLVAADGEGMAVLDAGTGEARSRTDELSDGWIIGAVDDTVVTLLHPDIDPSEPNRAGDPGAVVTGHDLVDGTVTWQRDVRSVEASFTQVGGMMIAPSSRHLTAIDAATGEVVWEVETTNREQVAQLRQVMGPWVTAPDPNVDPELVVTMEERDRMLRGRDVATGETVWERELQDRPWHVTMLGAVTMVQTNSGIDIIASATGQERLHLDSPDLQVAGIDPFVVFHAVSGHVARLDLPVATER